MENKMEIASGGALLFTFHSFLMQWVVSLQAIIAKDNPYLLLSLSQFYDISVFLVSFLCLHNSVGITYLVSGHSQATQIILRMHRYYFSFCFHWSTPCHSLPMVASAMATPSLLATFQPYFLPLYSECDLFIAFCTNGHILPRRKSSHYLNGKTTQWGFKFWDFVLHIKIIVPSFLIFNMNKFINAKP
jgi:hypothetical protein